MILISNGGTNTHTATSPSDEIVIGTVDGIALLRRSGGGWVVAAKALQGCFISAVTATPNGTLFAASHGVGVARSRDGGVSWDWCNTGIEHLDLWAARGGRLVGRDVVCVGSLPANVYLSEDGGDSWRVLPALRALPSTPHWCFPPAPRVGHVKDIVFDGDRLFVGVEIGALALSTDAGASFTDLPVDPNPAECDIHRILLHPARPDRIIVANGIVGVMSSDDRGRTWRKHAMPPTAQYPDAMVINPHDPDEIFMAAGLGWPPHWYARTRACGVIARSRDGGDTWERLLGGLPDGQRALFGALTVEAHDEGILLYSADTDGQVFESVDGGDHWHVIAEVAPVSKGEFYRALAKDRGRLANVDDLVFSDAAARRLAAAK